VPDCCWCDGGNGCISVQRDTEVRRVWTRAYGRTSSCSCGGLGLENKLLVCSRKSWL